MVRLPKIVEWFNLVLNYRGEGLIDRLRANGIGTLIFMLVASIYVAGGLPKRAKKPFSRNDPTTWHDEVPISPYYPQDHGVPVAPRTRPFRRGVYDFNSLCNPRNYSGGGAVKFKF